MKWADIGKELSKPIFPGLSKRPFFERLRRTVITFFTLPMLVFVIHLVLIGWPEALHGNAGAHLGEFKYVFEFHRTLAASRESHEQRRAMDSRAWCACA